MAVATLLSPGTRCPLEPTHRQGSQMGIHVAMHSQYHQQRQVLEGVNGVLDSPKCMIPVASFLSSTEMAYLYSYAGS